MRKVYTFLILAMLLVFSSAGWADEGKSKLLDSSYISGNLAFTTDYVFRGVSQTKEDPAIQGSFEYSLPSGFYLGLWGSNVDSSISEGDLELDFCGGYRRDITDRLNLDLSLLYYHYPSGGSDPEPDYVEAHVGLGYRMPGLPLAPEIGIGYWYSPDYFGEDGDAHYLNTNVAFSLAYGFVLGGELGYQTVEGDKTTGGGMGEDGSDGFDFWHWRTGLSKDVIGFGLDLSYHDTSEEEFLGQDIADDRVVFTISRSF